MQKTILFDQYSIEDLFKQIVNNSRQVRNSIKSTLSDLTQQIETLTDYQVLSPQISNYLNTLVKNDEILVKIAAVVSKIIAAKTKIQLQSQDGQLSTEEKLQLINQAKQQLKPFFEISKARINAN